MIVETFIVGSHFFIRDFFIHFSHWQTYNTATITLWFVVYVIFFFHCDSLTGMGEWKVSKCCGSEGQRVVLQLLWILWISKVHRRLTMLLTRWETGIFGLTTMNLGQCLVPFGALKTPHPLAVETLQDSLGEQLVQCLVHLCPFTPEKDVMKGE